MRKNEHFSSRQYFRYKILIYFEIYISHFWNFYYKINLREIKEIFSKHHWCPCVDDSNIEDLEQIPYPQIQYEKFIMQISGAGSAD